MKYKLESKFWDVDLSKGLEDLPGPRHLPRIPSLDRSIGPKTYPGHSLKLASTASSGIPRPAQDAAQHKIGGTSAILKLSQLKYCAADQNIVLFDIVFCVTKRGHIHQK